MHANIWPAFEVNNEIKRNLNVVIAENRRDREQKTENIHRDKSLGLTEKYLRGQHRTNILFLDDFSVGKKLNPDTELKLRSRVVPNVA